jgi:hypothetical protein
VTQIVIVPVEAPDIYREARRDHGLALFFNRSSATAAAQTPLAMRVATPRPSPEHFGDRYVMSYPVIEAYQQVSITASPALAGTIGLFRASFRPPEVEDEYRRANHQIFFQQQRTYPLQITFKGYSVEVPDLNGPEWQEWVHPPARPDIALYPFRQIYPTPSQVRGQQYNLYFGQPASPRLEPEADGIYVRKGSDFALTRGAIVTTKVITSCGVISAYDYGNGKVLVAWEAFGGGPPDSYNVYVNGVFNQNTTVMEALISGLIPATYNSATQVSTPAKTYVITVLAVSGGVEASTSVPMTITVQPTSIMLTTAMRRLWPFPNSGLD